ncbi:MAG: hypothetical protein OEW96_03335 [Betaproteobacteria bacterium]|nr:hypothetical protein [Betaproteobacteria bacterium]MDH5210694.1 hypothetical protein [Betaproteobacteria bacterium]
MALAPRLHLAVALGAGLLFAGAEAPAAGGTAQVSVEIPDGKTRTVRLRNLPRGAVVAVRVQAEGALQIALISATQLKSKKPEALFRGALDRSITFQVVLPEPGDYYLVLDNRRGSEPIKARATIRAEKKPTAPAPAEPGEKKPGGKFDQTRAAPARRA